MQPNAAPPVVFELQDNRGHRAAGPYSSRTRAEKAQRAFGRGGHYLSLAEVVCDRNAAPIDAGEWLWDVQLSVDLARVQRAAESRSFDPVEPEHQLGWGACIAVTVWAASRDEAVARARRAAGPLAARLAR